MRSWTTSSWPWTTSGGLLVIVARAGRIGLAGSAWSPGIQPGPAGVRRRGAEVLGVREFTATDDNGTSYRLIDHGRGHRPGEWTLWLSPEPPRDLCWLDLRTTPGQAAVRIDLTRPPASTDVTVSQVTTSPAEQLLTNIAMRLLATGAAFLPDIPDRLSEFVPTRPEPVAGLGEVIAGLQACGALSPLSPLPGQLAALCAQLDLTGHGITAPPARDLPEPWLGILAQHHRGQTQAAPERGGCAAVAVALPELDGNRLSLLGLANAADGTIVHLHAYGATCAYHGPAELDFSPAIWIRDSGGRWHATRVSPYHDGDFTTRLQVVPPLSRATAWIDVLAAGQSAEVRARLPLRWQ